MDRLDLSDYKDFSDYFLYNISQIISPTSKSEENMNSSSLSIAKLSAISILGFGSLLLGLFPILVRRKNKSESSTFHNITAILMYFGGGVLLATTFLHLLPEVTEQVEDLQKQIVFFKKSKNFPFAQCIMCFGFFLMFTIETIVHSFMNNHQHEVQNINIKAKNYSTCNNDNVHIIDPADSHVHHSHDHSAMLSTGSLRNFLIVMALSIHELFEGLVVGLEQNSTQVWYLLLAVACHKFVIAFCLGLQITNNTINNYNNKLFVINICYVVVFALCSPMGIALGMIVTLLTAVSSSSILLTLLSVILQGIATGTLLYIVFFEILKPHDIHTSKLRVIFCLIFLFMGFVLMAFLQFFFS